MSSVTKPSAAGATRRTVLAVACVLTGVSYNAEAQAVGAPVPQRIVAVPTPPYSRDTLGSRRLAPLPREPLDRLESALVTRTSMSRVAITDRGPGVWKYVGWGAVIGGVLAGGYAAYRTRDCDGCFDRGFIIGGATTVGAVVGGLIGSFVYADRYWSEDR